MPTPTAASTIQDIKTRLQAHHSGLWAPKPSGAAADAAARLSYRAEFDALWAAVETLAQIIDGAETVRVRDYFGER